MADGAPEGSRGLCSAPLSLDDCGGHLLERLLFPHIRSVYGPALKNWPHDDPDWVHDLRVAIRRFREAIDLVSPIVSPREARFAEKRLRALARGLSTRRAGDVGAGKLDHSEWKSSLGKKARRRLKKSLRNDGRQAFKDTRQRFHRSVLLRDQARMRRLVKASADDLSLRELGAASLASRLSDVESLVHTIEDPTMIEAHHRLRIRIKRLRYLLAILRRADPGLVTRDLVESAREAQSGLGELNDIHDLRHHLKQSRLKAKLGKPAYKKAQRTLHRAWADCYEATRSDFLARVPVLIKACHALVRALERPLTSPRSSGRGLCSSSELHSGPKTGTKPAFMKSGGGPERSVEAVSPPASSLASVPASSNSSPAPASVCPPAPPLASASASSDSPAEPVASVSPPAPSSASVSASSDSSPAPVASFSFDRPTWHAHFFSPIALSASGFVLSIGRYRVTRLLGQDATGYIYEGMEPGNKARVCIKILPSTLLVGLEEPGVEELNREIAFLTKADHPGVQRLVHMGLARHPIEGEIAFVVTERLLGHTLEAALNTEEGFSHPEALSIACSIAGVLAYLEANNIPCQSIRPANVYLEDGDRVVLTPRGFLGVTATPQSASFTRFGVSGDTTRSFLANMGRESRKGGGSWALGILLYRMFAGAFPFWPNGEWVAWPQAFESGWRRGVRDLVNALLRSEEELTAEVISQQLVALQQKVQTQIPLPMAISSIDEAPRQTSKASDPRSVSESQILDERVPSDHVLRRSVHELRGKPGSPRLPEALHGVAGPDFGPYDASRESSNYGPSEPSPVAAGGDLGPSDGFRESSNYGPSEAPPVAMGADVGPSDGFRESPPTMPPFSSWSSPEPSHGSHASVPRVLMERDEATRRLTHNSWMLFAFVCAIALVVGIWLGSTREPDAVRIPPNGMESSEMGAITSPP